MNFEQFLQQKNIIPKTISRHQREVLKYQNWLKTNNTNAENATKKQILDYLKHLKESRNLQAVTQSQILQKLKNYHTYLSQEIGINNPTNFIKIRGTNKTKLRPILTHKQLEELCDAYYFHIQEHEPNAKEKRHYSDLNKTLLGRYIALTLVCYQGLKPQELLSITKDDFDLRKATVFISQNRTGRERKMILDASQIGVLMQFYATEDTPIIANLNQLEKINKTLKTFTKKYEDLRQIRTSKITHWIKENGLRKAQYLAGHKHINSTEKYLANDFESLQNDFKNFHPLN